MSLLKLRGSRRIHFVEQWLPEAGGGAARRLWLSIACLASYLCSPINKPGTLLRLFLMKILPTMEILVLDGVCEVIMLLEDLPISSSSLWKRLALNTTLYHAMV